MTPDTVTAELRALRGRPFELMVALERRYGTVSEHSTAAATMDTWPGLAIRLGGHALIVPQSDVREVLELPTYTRVPRARNWLLGLANVRGDLLPIVDLQGLLSGHAGVLGIESRLLMFNHSEIPAGFLVDKVEGLRRFVPDQQRHELVREAPPYLAPHLLGAFVREGQSWWVLSLRKVALHDQFLSAAA
ncbi:MAG: chemotaxis protein CheW [Nevskiales bacterium]